MAEKLTARDKLWNAFNAISLPVYLALRLWFWVAINTRRASKDHSFAVPHGITLVANLAPPGYACTELWRYGVATCGGPVWRRIEGGQRTRVATIYVSSRQHWQADRTLRAAGWDVLSAPVVDRRRGDSALSAQSGPWQPWGVRAKAARGTCNCWRQQLDG